jgi:stage II sporulation protein D
MNQLIREEPKIKVGLMEQRRDISGRFNGAFCLHDGCLIEGDFRACVEADQAILFDAVGHEVARQKEIRCSPLSGGSTFTLFDVTIGVQFHWERKQEQTFQGILILLSDSHEKLIAVNDIHLEDYLASVISSEMSAEAPLEFLKAHAITSRSWLMAMLQSLGNASDPAEESISPSQAQDEIIRWYGREDHRLFDVCADDHCQRYQGVTRLISENARNAVQATRGVFLICDNNICDARYHKACGGLTENFDNTWKNRSVSYLTSVSDAAFLHEPVQTEADAERWIIGHPEAWCNAHDGNILRQILPSFDQETADFFRWEVVYSRTELEEIIGEKSGLDFGNILNLTPLERGPSGRIIRLKIEGSRRTAIVGKELEIRRWLSRSHLYSSAFVVSAEKDTSGLPIRFILHGAGWGHGVGLCQIGAAMMATQGYSAETILKHYFRGVEIKELY